MTLRSILLWKSLFLMRGYQHTYTGTRQSDGVDYALRLQHSIRFVYERDDETGIIYVK